MVHHCWNTIVSQNFLISSQKSKITELLHCENDISQCHIFIYTKRKPIITELAQRGEWYVFSRVCSWFCPESGMNITYGALDFTVQDLKPWPSPATFSYTHKVGNNDIYVNLILPQSCSFLHYLHLKMLVNVKLDVSR